MQQGSPLKDQFNDAILKLLNERKLETLKERWWNKNPNRKVCVNKDESDGISLQNIGGVFIVIFMGIVLACLTLLFEYWWYKVRKGAGRVSDSANAVLSVKEFSTSAKGNGKGFDGTMTDFNTEYNP